MVEYIEGDNMKKKNLSLLLAAILSVSYLIGSKKSDNVSDILNYLEDSEDSTLKNKIALYQNKSILDENNYVFEHRCANKVNTSSLYNLLEGNLTKLERVIVEGFINDNGIKNDNSFVDIPENTSVGYIVSNLINEVNVELDIQFTKDNVPVLFHDNDLSRATGGVVKSRIKDFTLDEINKIKVFYGDKNYSYIPTLAEILLLHKGEDYKSLLIEVKLEAFDGIFNNYSKTFYPIKTAIDNTSFYDRSRIYLMSGNQFFIFNYNREFNDMGIKTGITLYSNQFLRELFIRFYKDYYDFISVNFSILNKDLLLSAFDSNKAVFIGSSTTEGINDLTKLFEYLGVYDNLYIITDKPDKYEDLLNNIKNNKVLKK